MSELTPERKEAAPRGNLGVHAGAVVLIACFFLPWVTLGGYSGLELTTDETKAGTTLMVLLDRYLEKPLIVTRVLWVAPVLALSTLVIDLTIRPGHHARGTARVCILVGGGTLCVLFATLGLRFGSLLAYGFWWSLSGALLISVGGTFDVFRGE